jgi:hypothetical protein
VSKPKRKPKRHGAARLGVFPDQRQRRLDNNLASRERLHHDFQNPVQQIRVAKSPQPTVDSYSKVTSVRATASGFSICDVPDSIGELHRRNTASSIGDARRRFCKTGSELAEAIGSNGSSNDNSHESYVAAFKLSLMVPPPTTRRLRPHSVRQFTSNQSGTGGPRGLTKESSTVVPGLRSANFTAVGGPGRRDLRAGVPNQARTPVPVASLSNATELSALDWPASRRRQEPKQ